VALRSALVGDSTIALHCGTGGGAGQHDAEQQHADAKLASDDVAAAVDGGVLPTDGGVIGGGEGVGAAVVDGLPLQCRDGSEDGDVLEQPAARQAEDAAAAEFLYGRGLKQTDCPTSDDEEFVLQEEMITSMTSDEETGGDETSRQSADADGANFGHSVIAAGDGRDEDTIDGVLPPPSDVPAGVSAAVTNPFTCVEHLYAYLLLRGQDHITQQQYEVTRAAFNIASPVKLPSINTIRYEISPTIERKWMLQTSTCWAPQDGKDGLVEVNYVKPSEHIRRDLQFERTFALFKEADARTDLDRELHPEFVDSPLFQDRSTVLLGGQTVPRFVLAGVSIVVGDRLDVDLGGGRVVNGVVVDDAFFVGSTSGLAPDDGHHAGDFLVRCGVADGGPADIVARHWHAATLHPLSWLTDDGEAAPIHSLRHHEYDVHPQRNGRGDDQVAAGSMGQAATDGSGQANGGGHDAHARAAALQIRADDVSAGATSCREGVQRAPTGTNEEKRTGDAEDSGVGGSKSAGALPSRPRRLLSGTRDGVAFLVVCLCFFSDDFRARLGKEVSLGGVYMSYLSWLFRHRRSSHSVRTLAATPPDVDSDVVLEAITPDLRAGATDGWLMTGADGTDIRVLADVCFYVGDYLQVAKTSKLMGHGANSPCTMCAYRLSGAPGCRYGLEGASNLAKLVRTTARTRSVCKAVAERAATAGEQ